MKEPRNTHKVSNEIFTAVYDSPASLPASACLLLLVYPGRRVVASP